MQQYVNVNIDGAIIKAMRGTSVLDTAIEYGICIPHLCHVPNLSDIGACRLCIVEHVVHVGDGSRVGNLLYENDRMKCIKFLDK